MARVTLVGLASQAEKEGITLAEVISRTLDPRELDLMQAELADELSENYQNIEEFMSGVEVPSLGEMMNLEEAVESRVESIA
jgi:ribosome-binding protein aMBF1 (putative translation factor)